MSRSPISPKQLRLRIAAVAMIPKLLQSRLGNKSHRAESPLGEAYILALPQEILDAILDFLFNDKLDLKHCTLVLRAWLCRARRHLFRDMNVLVTRLAEFRDFLAEDPAYVCNSIRFLKVKSQFSAAPVRLRDIHGCFMLLPAMDHLTLSSVSIARNEDRSPLGGAPTPGRFHKLTLSSMTVDAHDISQFLLLCPSRCELRLRRQCYMRQPPPAEAVIEEMNTLSITHGMKAKSSRHDKGHVKTLVMGSWEHSQDGLAAELLQSTNLLAGLISVYWHFIHDDAKRVVVKKFLEAHGATLKWVGLDFLHFEYQYRTYPGVGLASCRNVTWLKLTFGDPRKSTKLLSGILDEVFGASALNSCGLILEFELSKSFIKHIHVWDGVLGSYKPGSFSNIKFWSVDPWAAGLDSQTSRSRRHLLNATEREGVLDNLPKIAATGVLSFQ